MTTAAVIQYQVGDEDVYGVAVLPCSEITVSYGQGKGLVLWERASRWSGQTESRTASLKLADGDDVRAYEWPQALLAAAELRSQLSEAGKLTAEPLAF